MSGLAENFARANKQKPNCPTTGWRNGDPGSLFPYRFAGDGYVASAISAPHGIQNIGKRLRDESKLLRLEESNCHIPQK